MLYTATNLHPVSRLHYAWTGWPTEGTTLPPLPDLDALTAAWRTDGMRLLAHDANTSRIMLTFDAGANIAPTLLAQRVKGRLNNTLRLAGTPASFSRKVSVRTLGENISDVV